MIRKRLGLSVRFRVPTPYPTVSTTMGGMTPKVAAKPFKRAAPVGVTNSCLSPESYTGMPFKRATVAGAGMGILP